MSLGSSYLVVIDVKYGFLVGVFKSMEVLSTYYALPVFKLTSKVYDYIVERKLEHRRLEIITSVCDLLSR